MKKVYIGSRNPVKISCTQLAFKKAFPNGNFQFVGVDVLSNVSHQPMTDEETRTGSMSRARNTKENHPDGDYWIGIEGGIAADYTASYDVTDNARYNITGEYLAGNYPPGIYHP